LNEECLNASGITQVKLRQTGTKVFCLLKADVYRLSYIKDDESGSTEGRSKKIRLHKTVAWLPETSNDLDRFLADNLSSSVKYDATKNFKDVCPESAERYKEALNCFGKVVSNTIDTILKLGLSFDIWGEIIENLQKISSSQPLRVGVSGDSGQGKSSVIGALLGDMKLTKAVSPSIPWYSMQAKFI